LRRYPKITFDKETAFKNSDAEFVTFGHPLFEATMTWVENTCSALLTPRYDYDGEESFIFSDQMDTEGYPGQH